MPIYVMTGRKNRALQVPPVVPYKALEKFPKALYGTMLGTCSARFLRPVMFVMQGLCLQCMLGPRAFTSRHVE